MAAFVGMESPADPAFSLRAEYEGMTYFHVTDYQSWVVHDGEWVRDTGEVMQLQLDRARQSDGLDDAPINTRNGVGGCRQDGGQKNPGAASTARGMTSSVRSRYE